VGEPDAKGNGEDSPSPKGGSRRRGVVHILEIRCKGCGFCVEFCPRGVLAVSERYNAKGYHPPEIVALEACTACRLCELLCPDFALGIEALGQAPVPRGRTANAPSGGTADAPPAGAEVEGAR